MKQWVRSYRRVVFVFGVIILCFGLQSAWSADWSGLLQRVGINAAQSQDAANIPVIGQLPESKEGLESQETKVAPRKDIEPDYTLPPAEDGQIPVISRIPTEQKVVFLTLDDGMSKVAEAPRLLKAQGIRAPMFLNDVYALEDPGYFQRLAGQGMTVASHTMDHADLTTLSLDGQRTEICGNVDTMQQMFGVRPSLFRPPYGSYDGNTLQAAAECGMRAVVMWSAKANGGSMQYQDGNAGLVPGDIVLMHFRPEFKQDFQAFIDAAEAAGLQPENLDEWLQTPSALPESNDI